MQLEKELKNYKELTVKLIDSIGNIEELEDLINERQNLINKIELIQYDSDQFKKIASELNLANLEEELVNKIKKEKVNIRSRLENVRKLKQARSIYNKKDARPVFFNMRSY